MIAIAIATARFFELFMLLFIIFIHEMGHAVTATFFSWRIKRISLLPFGGVVEMDEHGNRPLKEEALVVLAGPLQHLWMMGGAILLYELSWLSFASFILFIKYNLMILTFNLLPIWPLDGGKLLFLLLSLYKSFPKAHQTTLILSGFFIFIFILFVLIISPTHLNIWIVLSFLLFSLTKEWKHRRYVFMRFLIERYSGKKDHFRSLRPLKVREEELVIHVLERFQRGYKHPIIILKNDTESGFLDENELLHAYFTEKLLTAKIGDLHYSF